MRGTRWPDGNRTRTAETYMRAASWVRQKLRKEKSPEDPGSWREWNETTRGLQYTREKLRELTDWLGEFDSARTLLEERPEWKEFVSVMFGKASVPGPWMVGKIKAKRKVGGPGPEWMRAWVGTVVTMRKGIEEVAKQEVVFRNVGSSVWKGVWK